MEAPTKSFCELFYPLRLVRGLTLPVLSYFTGWEFTEKLQEAFQHARLEDCWIPYFCITTNMTTSDMNVHYTGTMWRLIRASMTVVGLLPPIVDSDTGELLVDG
jgi:lysophospholipid hydrolase